MEVLMSRKFTRRFTASNQGGIQVPYHKRFGAQWRILMWDAEGSLSFVEVHLPNDSCPRKWLEERKMTLGEDALAEIIC